MSLIPPNVGATQAPRLRYLSSPLADFLHLLFFREVKSRFAAFSPPGFSDLPRLNSLVAVPESVASAGVTTYSDLEAFLAAEFSALPTARVGGPRGRILSYSNSPPALETVQATVAAGEPYFDQFQNYWRREVRPQVDEQIAQWRVQERELRPFELLQSMHGISLDVGIVNFVAMPFHPAGSANYSPAGIYTGLFRQPDLAWVLGHEGSHLLWSREIGANWRSHPLARTAIQSAEGIDIEEAVCLFMQTRLSTECGLTPASDAPFGGHRDGPLKSFLLALEAAWPDYRESRTRERNLIDLALSVAMSMSRPSSTPSGPSL